MGTLNVQQTPFDDSIGFDLGPGAELKTATYRVPVGARTFAATLGMTDLLCGVEQADLRVEVDGTAVLEQHIDKLSTAPISVPVLDHKQVTIVSDYVGSACGCLAVWGHAEFAP